ncbi:MAG: hypothetical protein AAB778_01640, partial [Patescibacteria group bacterium]
ISEIIPENSKPNTLTLVIDGFGQQNKKISPFPLELAAQLGTRTVPVSVLNIPESYSPASYDVDASLVREALKSHGITELPDHITIVGYSDGVGVAKSLALNLAESGKQVNLVSVTGYELLDVANSAQEFAIKFVSEVGRISLSLWLPPNLKYINNPFKESLNSLAALGRVLKRANVPSLVIDLFTGNSSPMVDQLLKTATANFNLLDNNIPNLQTYYFIPENDSIVPIDKLKALANSKLPENVSIEFVPNANHQGPISNPKEFVGRIVSKLNGTATISSLPSTPLTARIGDWFNGILKPNASYFEKYGKIQPFDNVTNENLNILQRELEVRNTSIRNDVSLNQDDNTQWANFLIDNTKGPVLEIGGPSLSGYKIIDIQSLKKPITVTNINGGVKFENIGLVGIADKKLDATNMNLKPNSVGSFISKSLPKSIYPEYFSEAYKALEPDGIIVIDSTAHNSELIPLAESTGFKFIKSYVDSNSQVGLVFQKPGFESISEAIQFHVAGVLDGVKTRWNNFIDSKWNPAKWIGGNSPAGNLTIKEIDDIVSTSPNYVKPETAQEIYDYFMKNRFNINITDISDSLITDAYKITYRDTDYVLKYSNRSPESKIRFKIDNLNGQRLMAEYGLNGNSTPATIIDTPDGPVNIQKYLEGTLFMDLPISEQELIIKTLADHDLTIMDPKLNIIQPEGEPWQIFDHEFISTIPPTLLDKIKNIPTQITDWWDESIFNWNNWIGGNSPANVPDLPDGANLPNNSGPKIREGGITFTGGAIAASLPIAIYVADQLGITDKVVETYKNITEQVFGTKKKSDTLANKPIVPITDIPANNSSSVTNIIREALMLIDGYEPTPNEPEPFVQWDERWKDQVLVYNCKNPDGTRSNRTMGNISCGPTSTANILNEFNLSNELPTNIANEMLLTEQLDCDGTSWLENVNYLEKYNVTYEKYLKPLSDIPIYTDKDAIIWISANFWAQGFNDSLSHHAYFNGYSMEKLEGYQYEQPVFNLVDPNWGTDYKCIVTTNYEFDCKNQDGKYLKILGGQDEYGNWYSPDLIIINPPDNSTDKVDNLIEQEFINP